MMVKLHVIFFSFEGQQLKFYKVKRKNIQIICKSNQKMFNNNNLKNGYPIYNFCRHQSTEKVFKMEFARI